MSETTGPYSIKFQGEFPWLTPYKNTKVGIDQQQQNGRFPGKFRLKTLICLNIIHSTKVKLVLVKLF